MKDAFCLAVQDFLPYFLPLWGPLSHRPPKGCQCLHWFLLGMPLHLHHTVHLQAFSCACLAFQEVSFGKVSSAKSTRNTHFSFDRIWVHRPFPKQPLSLLPNLKQAFSSPPLLQEWTYKTRGVLGQSVWRHVQGAWGESSPRPSQDPMTPSKESHPPFLVPLSASPTSLIGSLVVV